MAKTPSDDDAPEEMPRGRPSKLTPERIELAVSALLHGNFRGTVARMMGVSPRTFYSWMKQGKKFPGGIYGHFRRAVIMAEAEAESRMLEEIRSAGKDDARFLCWILERKHPDRYGRYRGELVELKKQMREIAKKLGMDSDGDGDDLPPEPAAPSPKPFKGPSAW